MSMPSKQHSQTDDIKLLKGLDPIRLRPGMYMGVNINGIYQMLYEVLDNSLHEAMAKQCDLIEITLNADRSITISDNGRGIPVTIVPGTNYAVLELRLSVMSTPGLRSDYQYHVSGGLHGVGLLAVNALSEWLIAEVRRDGFLWRQSYARGMRTSNIVKVRPLANDESTGTSITFLPDAEIFVPIWDNFDFDYELLIGRCRQLAYLLPGVAIRLTDQRVTHPPRETTFHFEGGVEAFIKDLNRDRLPLHAPIIGMKKMPMNHEQLDQNLVEIEFAFQYTDDSHITELMFVNTLETPDGGTHLTGLRTALTRTINRQARKTGYLKRGDAKFIGPNTRKGLTAVVSLKHPNPWFESMTILRLINPEVNNMVASVISGVFAGELEKHTEEARRIFNHLRRDVENG